MNLKFLICIFCLSLLLTGCSRSLSEPEPLEDTWSDSGYVKIGHNLTINNSDNRLTLLENRDTLSAEGLYYATWAMGNPTSFENSDGDTVDLYDAHLYLLLGEYPSADQALTNMNKWLAAGRNNYDILTEEEITCNGQDYTMLSYQFSGADNPYERGISVFGTFDKQTICIELTCQEHFQEDLRTIIIPFLDNCFYEAK